MKRSSESEPSIPKTALFTKTVPYTHLYPGTIYLVKYGHKSFTGTFVKPNKEKLKSNPIPIPFEFKKVNLITPHEGKVSNLKISNELMMGSKNTAPGVSFKSLPAELNRTINHLGGRTKHKSNRRTRRNR